MPLPLSPSLAHFCTRVVSIQGFTVVENSTPVAAKVGGVTLIQDEYGVSDVSVYKICPGVGSVCCSTLPSL